MDELRIFPDEYVPNIQGVPYHKQWVKANPGENAKWITFRDDVIAGKQVTPPTMSSKYGQALVAAGKEHMAVSSLVGTVVSPNPTPPPAGGGGGAIVYDSPTTISAGGTYTGNWESTSASVAPVTIATTSAVTILNSNIRDLLGQTNQSVGPLILCASANARVTVRNTYFYGGWNRAIFANAVASLTVENCTIDKTTGIYITHPAAGAPVTIRYNRAHNIQGIPITSGGYSTQFAQFDTSTGTAVVGWNEVINEFGLSHVEDLISIFTSSNVRVHDNFLWGGYPTLATDGRSGYGIILSDYGGGPNIAEDNIIVATYGGIGVAGGNGNIVRRNRLVEDHKLDNGTQLTASDGTGMYAYSNPTPCTNTTFTDNVVGWMGRVAGVDQRNDAYLPGGFGTVETGRVTLASPITHQMELDEYAGWLAKLVTNGVTIGAS